MKLKYFIPVFIFSVFIQSSPAQTYKNWRTFLAYGNATQVVETNDRVFVLSNSALYSYGKEDKEIRLYSKLSGLNDTDISLIRYSPENKTLVIVYSNGNIDLFGDDGIKNMPDLKNVNNIQDKGVNDIYFYNQFAYFSTNFGIMVVNLSKKEVTDTYRMDENVRALCIQGDSIIAATASGLLKGHVKDNLLDRQKWDEKQLNTTAFNGDEIINLCLFQNNLVFCIRSKGVFYEEAPGDEIKRLVNLSSIRNIKVLSNTLLVFTPANLSFYTDMTNFISVPIGTIYDVASLKGNGIYWIASGANELIGIERGAENTFNTIVSEIQINAPKRNFNAFMTIQNDRLLVTGGDRYTDRFYRPGTLIIYDGDQWFNFDESIVNTEVIKILNITCRDYMGVAVDPDDDNHFFIATYGEGIVELKDNAFVELYNITNSTLRGAESTNNSPYYVRIGSVCFDKDKNLWAANCLTQDAIKIRKPNGEWLSLYYSDINNADKLDKILITSRGHKWINVPYDNSGIFVLDDNNTIEDTSDDTFHFYSVFTDALSSTGATIPASQYLCMAEDKNGTIWIGTNIGPLKCTSPATAASSPETLKCARLVRDNEAYFLSGETVNAIAVDAENQKWIGTATQGVFLINDDGTETIYHFTTDNSPLPSNTIKTIVVNETTGEVFFGTDNGISAYKSGVAIDSKPFSNVYAFPNPVRPEHNDKVTISGLANNATVKITDGNGNLICEGRAVGTQFVWNCRSIHGTRVATGIYFVFSTTSSTSSTESVVTKIAVVK